MKILHTSDWHLGQSFMGKKRDKEHEEFLDWLSDTVKEKNIDVVIISGDIFDTGAPPAYAQELYFDSFTKLRETVKKVVVIGGNHDSIALLKASKKLLEHLGVHVIAGDESPENCVISLEWDGKLHGVICAVPYLRDSVIRSNIASTTSEKEQALQEGMARFYEKAFQKAKEIAKNKPVPIIATGHLTLQGVTLQDGEREIYIGKEKAIRPKIFDPFDYVALGHIHRYKEKSKRIYYSGSPIPLSFSEIDSCKNVLIVEFDEKKPKISSIDIPIFRHLFRIEGKGEEILKKLEEIKQKYKSAWVEVWLEDGKYVDKIREAVKDSDIEILAIRLKKSSSALTQEDVGIEELSEQSLNEIFEKKLQEANIEDEQKFKELFDKVIQEVISDENYKN